jgi:hypothetical protein
VAKEGFLGFMGCQHPSNDLQTLLEMLPKFYKTMRLGTIFGKLYGYVLEKNNN